MFLPTIRVRFVSFLIGLVVLLILASPAWSDPGSDRRVAELEQKVLRLETQLLRYRDELDETWLNQRRAEQVKALVREVLADADTRASLLNNGMTAGYTNGFFLASDDNRFRLNIAGRTQVHYYFTHRDDSGADDSVGGFEVARTRLLFTGHIGDPSLTFAMMPGFSSSGTAQLLDAYITKHFFDSGMKISAGQFKLPFYKEFLISETRQQFVDRTLVSAAFGGGYTQGVLIQWEQDALRLAFSVNDGAGGMNTNFTVDATDFAMTGRLDILLYGEWKCCSEFEGWHSSEPTGSLGMAVHYQKGERGTTAPDTDVFRWTADASFQMEGANIFMAIVGSHLSGSTSADQLGAMIQVGVFITDQVELLARYEWGDLDTSGTPDLSIVTVGVAWYINKHALKFTTDVGFGLNSVHAFWANTAAGWLADGVGQDGQIVLRSQVQLLF